LLSCVHSYIKNVSGANDGLVSEKSAQWRYPVVKIEGEISHSEVIDLKEKDAGGIFIPSIYENIARNLAQMGF
jgi:predicted nucleotide-binding protein (sugar kinase/HSP70/actin superfamily)